MKSKHCRVRELARHTIWSNIWKTISDRLQTLANKYVTWKGRKLSWSTKLRLALKKATVLIRYSNSRSKKLKRKNWLYKTRLLERISETLRERWKIMSQWKRRIAKMLSQVSLMSSTVPSCRSFLPSARSTITGIWRETTSTGCSRSRQGLEAIQCWASMTWRMIWNFKWRRMPRRIMRLQAFHLPATMTKWRMGWLRLSSKS